MSQQHGSPKGNFDLGKYIIARLHRGKNNFEMIADPEEAHKSYKVIQDFRLKQKQDKEITVDDILHNPDITLTDIFPTFDIFTNVKKFDRCNETDLEEAFETNEGRKIAAIFMKEADFAWTHEQRQKWMEKKRKQIVTILARNCINPQTKKPHPPKRIEKAMDESRVSLDLNKTAEEQIDDVLKKIKLVIPIRFESIKMALKVPATYAAKSYNIVEKYAHVVNSEWQTDGSWVGVINLPAGLQMELLEKINHLTHGRAQSKLM